MQKQAWIEVTFELPEYLQNVRQRLYSDFGNAAYVLHSNSSHWRPFSVKLARQVSMQIQVLSYDAQNDFKN